MNRIQDFLGTLSPNVEQRSVVVEAGRFERSGRESGQVLFSPLHYEPNYAYPLVVWLHGPGDDERQLRRVMPLVSLRNYVAVAPRGTLAGAEVEPPVRGFSWSQDVRHVEEAEARVFRAIETAAERFNVAPQRVFLAGFQAGGTMALRLALAHPRSIAGVASFGGEFPSGGAPLRRINELRNMNLLLATCRDSALYPQARVCEHLRLIHSAGMNISLRQYPCGDDLTTCMLSDFDRWIMDLVTSQPSVPVDEAANLRGE